MQTKEAFRSHKQILAELAAARDEVRVQLHLLSLEARERWQELEKTLDAVEQKLNQSSEQAAAGVVAKVHEATQTARDFLKSHAHRAAELDAPVSSIMSPNVRTCGPDDSLNHVAQLLWEGNCGSLPVVGAHGALLGMITDRDICMASYTQGRSLAELSVESAMSRGVYLCGVDEPIARALALMSEKQVHRLPIVSSTGQIVGIVAVADIARWAYALPRRQVALEALASTLAAISEQRDPS
jgi:CBS domain-containing protein